MSQQKMQSHIDKAYGFLDDFLPKEYTTEVIKILRKKKISVSSSVVRNVRTTRTTNRIDVLNALLLVAKRNKKLLEEMKSHLNN